MIHGSDAARHLCMLDRVCGGSVICKTGHMCTNNSLCMLFEVWYNVYRPLHDYMPAPFIASPITRRTLAVHRNALMFNRNRIEQLVP